MASTKTRGEKGNKAETPSRAQVEERAYQIYLDRVEKGLPGDELSDWLAAEAKAKS
jgi:hypothetical protein